MPDDQVDVLDRPILTELRGESSTRWPASGARPYRTDQAATRHRAVVQLPPGATSPREVLVVGRLRGDQAMRFDDLSVDAKVAIARVLYAAGPVRCDGRSAVPDPAGRRVVVRCDRGLGHGAARDFGVTPDGRLLCGGCCA